MICDCIGCHDRAALTIRARGREMAVCEAHATGQQTFGVMEMETDAGDD
jgi:hypothetical protein